VRNRRILIIGGTREARELAKLLAEAGAEPVTSLAGVTGEPAMLVGETRRGSFGGVEGLVEFLERERFDAIADAAHPFATQISSHAAEAAKQCGIPIVRVERPPWRARQADRWALFDSADAIAQALPRDSRVFLTIGRKGIAPFFSRQDLTGVARMIEPPAVSVPSGWKIIRERPPFTLADELALIDREQISVLVTKNSGGEDTRAKLDAARERRISVYLIDRPVKPEVPNAATPEAVLPLLASALRA
jgi:precorrin-6A/cobalt-precorrin-6A reductase